MVTLVGELCAAAATLLRQGVAPAHVARGFGEASALAEALACGLGERGKSMTAFGAHGHLGGLHAAAGADGDALGTQSGLAYTK